MEYMRHDLMFAELVKEVGAEKLKYDETKPFVISCRHRKSIHINVNRIFFDFSLVVIIIISMKGV